MIRLGVPAYAADPRIACGPDTAHLFFAPDQERGNSRALREAKANAICHTCPLRKPCREFAIDAHEPHGTWGALTPAQRAAHREHRAAIARWTRKDAA